VIQTVFRSFRYGTTGKPWGLVTTSSAGADGPEQTLWKPDAEREPGFVILVVADTPERCL
jgi:hypothetical protein